MKKLKFLAALFIALSVLSACGTDTIEENVVTTTQPSPHTITVIDGYLLAANICADRNANLMCDEGEIVGQTDAMGKITISADDSEFSVIANIVAGETSDADTFGTVPHSYQMIANSREDVISPFTTIAVLSNMSIDTLAATINLPHNIIGMNYVALKEDNNHDAIKVHAIARGIASNFPAKLSEVNTDNLIPDIITTITVVDQFINEHSFDELNNVTIKISGIIPTITTNYSSLNDYLVSQDAVWGVVSSNNFINTSRGFERFEINGENNELTRYDHYGNFSYTAPYLIDGNKLVSIESRSDDFIVHTDTIALVKSNANQDLAFWAKKVFEHPVQSEILSTTIFENETWYLITDISVDESTDIKSIALSFAPLDGSPEGIVDIVEDGNTTNGSYYIIPSQDLAGNVVSEIGVIMPLHIQFGNNERLQLVKVTESEGLMIMQNMLNGSYSAMTKEKELADSIVSNFQN